MIEEIIRILILFITGMVLLLVPQSAENPESTPPSTGSLTGIGISVDPGSVALPEDFPGGASPLNIGEINLEISDDTITVSVGGYQNHGCELEVEIDQRLEGETIIVRIYQIIPENVRCPRNIVDYSGEFTLDVPLTRGTTYTLDVNGLTLDFGY